MKIIAELYYQNWNDNELLSYASEEGIYNRQIYKEWHRRYGLNFPYRLNEKHVVLNCITGRETPDIECDRLILNQAKNLRKKEGIDNK